MPIDPNSMAAGYDQTLEAIRRSLEDRIQNHTTYRVRGPIDFHRGIPDESALQQEGIGVWLDWTDIDRDDDEPEHTTLLTSRWLISIVGRNEGSDAFGAEAPAVERVWGDILKTLCQTVGDIGLDGNIDFLPTPSARKAHATLEGGGKSLVIEMDLDVHHSMELIILPP